MGYFKLKFWFNEHLMMLCSDIRQPFNSYCKDLAILRLIINQFHESFDDIIDSINIKSYGVNEMKFTFKKFLIILNK